MEAAIAARTERLFGPQVAIKAGLGADFGADALQKKGGVRSATVVAAEPMACLCIRDTEYRNVMCISHALDEASLPQMIGKNLRSLQVRLLGSRCPPARGSFVLLKTHSTHSLMSCASLLIV